MNMPKRSDLARLAIITAFALSLGTGCTKEAKKARFLSGAESDFKVGAYDKAKIEYLNVLRLDGQNATAFVRLGQMWFEEGAPLRAGAFLVKASELSPNDLENRLRLARTYNAVGKRDEAKKETLSVLQHSTANGEALMLLTEMAFTPEEISGAEQALQKFPHKESAWYQLAAANIAIRKSDLTTARILVTRALELEPKLPQAHQTAGILDLLQKDPEGAAAEFKTAAELAPPRSSVTITYAEYQIQSGQTGKATAFLQNLTSKTPDFFPAWNLLARIALAGKHYEQALTLLENVLSRDPDNLDARVLQANTWLAKRETAKAVAALERLDNAHPGAPALKVQLARAYLQDNKLAQAATVLSAAVSASPNYADAILLLAEINLRNGQAAPAVTALEGLLKTRPDLKKAPTLLADAYRAAGRLDDAAAIFHQQIEQSPANAQPFFFLGVIQRQQKKTEEARRSFEKVLELAPDSVEALNQLVEMDLIAKDFAGAMGRVQRLMEKKPNNAFSYLLVGKVRTTQKEWPEAEAALKKAIDLNPELSTAYQLLVAVYLATNRLPEASRELEEILAKSPQNQAALMTLASIAEKQKDYAKAADTYAKLLTFKPDSVPALNNQAYLYAEWLNQLEKALELARKARTLAPSDPAVADTLGWVLFKRGDYQQALELGQEAVGKISNNSAVQFHLGMAHYMMGQTEAAASAFQQALAAPEDFPSKAEAQRRLNLLGQTSGGLSAPTVAQLEGMVKQYPDDVVARIRLGELYEKQNAFDRAASAYQEALKSNPELVSVTLKLSQLYAGPLHDVSRALEFAKKARDLAPTDLRVAGLLGKIAYDAGNFSWAYSLLQESSREHGADAQVFHDLAWAAYSLGKVQEAREGMERCLEASPEAQTAGDAKSFLALTAAEQDPAALAAARPQIEEKLAVDSKYVPALMAAAAADVQAEDKKEAISRYQSVLQKFPDFAPAQKQLAILYSEDATKISDAYDLASKARKSLPADPAVTQLLGQLSYQRKEYLRALQLLRESAKRKPLDAKGLYYLGLAYKESNQPGEAKKALSEALSSGLPKPLSDSAQQAQKEMENKP